jgi:hypothetical protein
MTQNELPPGETGMLRALHKDTDERQWQRVLALALREDLANARAFVEAALRSAAQDKTGGRRAAKLLERLPTTVRVFTEQPLRTTRRRSPLLGRADLVFRSGGRDDWAVVVELKLTAGYGTDQLARYLDHGAPVLSVVAVRDVTASREVSWHGGWLGEALWRDLQPTLRGLSWPRGGKAMWLALLDGMQAVWDDPPSFALEIERERDLVTRLKNPLGERAKALVAEHVTLARAEMVETTEIGEELDGFGLAVTSGPVHAATERLEVWPLYERGELREVEITWSDPAAGTSGPRSLGQLHREGFVMVGVDVARKTITISPGEIEATDLVTATLDAIDPELERIIPPLWRRRNPPGRRRSRRQR